MRVVNVGTEGVLNGIQIGAVAVCGELDAVCEPERQIIHQALWRIELERSPTK